MTMAMTEMMRTVLVALTWVVDHDGDNDDDDDDGGGDPLRVT